MLPASVSAFGTFLMRQFFITVPDELMEAAKVDGCNPVKMFFTIALPMAKSTIATLCIFSFMGVWNDYFTPLIYLNDSRKYTLPLGLASMQGMYSTNWPVLMAASVIAVIPVLIAFLLAQDAFVKGVMMSGLKE
jgi:multiple sugar transport system permease protein